MLVTDSHIVLYTPRVAANFVLTVTHNEFKYSTIQCALSLYH
jgi:hypothetical protein